MEVCSRQFECNTTDTGTNKWWCLADTRTGKVVDLETSCLNHGQGIAGQMTSPRKGFPDRLEAALPAG